MYSPDFLDFLPEGTSSVVYAWLKALASGKKIGTIDYTGCSWTDIGTPAAYAVAVFEGLEKAGETLYVHPSADCGKAEIKGRVVLESGCIIGEETYLKNCIVLPDAQIPDGKSIEDAVIGPDYLIRLEKAQQKLPPNISENIIESFFQIPQKNIESALIGTGGSDRKYYRLNDHEKSAVLMVCSAEDPDFERHIAYTEFFRGYLLPVPEMFAVDCKQKQALFEDLGDLSLYSWLKCRRGPASIESMYRRVLDILVKLHSTVSINSSESPLLCSRVFDYEHLRWETSYFIERFVSGHIGMTVKEGNTLKEEFQVLAKTVDSFPKAAVHRDFQSQNLMITKDEVPRVIDYQGARIGPPAYDLASVLWDPYYRLDDDMRERLICYYTEKMRADTVTDFDKDEFRYSLMLCRLQRHMQALGAYGFLSKMKGKKYFLRHIPQAMEYLTEETALAVEDFSALHELVMKLDSACKRDRTGR
jgi:aminoglycoside/choline kinase family phosphotransferase